MKLSAEPHGPCRISLGAALLESPTPRANQQPHPAECSQILGLISWACRPTDRALDRTKRALRGAKASGDLLARNR